MKKTTLLMILSWVMLWFVGCSNTAQPTQKRDIKKALLNKTIYYNIKPYKGQIEYIDANGSILYYRPKRNVERGKLEFRGNKVCMTYERFQDSCHELKGSNWEEILDNEFSPESEVTVADGDYANIRNIYKVQQYNIQVKEKNAKIKQQNEERKKRRSERLKKELIGKRVISYEDFKVESNDCLRLAFVGKVTCWKVGYRMGVIGKLIGIKNGKYQVKVQNIILASQPYVSLSYWKYKPKAKQKIQEMNQKFRNQIFLFDNAKRY